MDILPDKIPFFKVRSETLGNGLDVYLHENPASPTVNIQVWIRTGSIHEGADLGSGLSHFLEHMIFQGSEKYPGNRIAELSAALGGEVNAYTSWGNTVYHMDILSRNFDAGLDILADAVLNPRFPAGAFAKEKEVILRERAMASDNAGRMLSENLWLTMFKIHPIRHPVVGYKDLIAGVDRKMMRAYYGRRYSPARSFVVISGDVGCDEAFQAVRDKFGRWSMGCIEDPPLPEEKPQAHARSASSTFKDPLARMAVGYHVPDASHADVPALDILSMVLGQNRSSRLVSRVENEKHLAIGVSAMNYTPYFTGIFCVTATCEKAKLGKLRDEIGREISVLGSKDPVRPDEVAKSANFIVTDFCQNLRTNTNMARIIGTSVLNYGDPEFIHRYIENILRVTPEDVMRAAVKYLTAENSTYVELLPEDCAAKAAAMPRKSKSAGAAELLQVPGGCRLVARHDDRLPLIDICVFMPGGIIFEDGSKAGVARLAGELVDKGTRSFDERSLDDALDAGSIDFDATAGYNALSFSMSFHAANARRALELFSSIISEPVFPEKQFRREKENLLQIIESRKLNPNAAAEQLLRRKLFGKHPYSRPTLGLAESIAELDRGAVEKYYYESCLDPEWTVFGIAGGFDEKEILPRFMEVISRVPWSRKRAVLPERPRFPSTKSSEKISLPREQSVVMLGLPSCDLLNGDRHPMSLLAKALNGMNSRLFKEIRIKNGMAYYTGFTNFSGFHEGMASFYVGTRPDLEEKVLEMFEKARQHLAEGKGISKKEFHTAKASISLEIAETLAENSALIFNSAASEFMGIGHLEPFRLEKIYSDITLPEVNAAAKKYFANTNTTAAIATPDNHR